VRLANPMGNVGKGGAKDGFSAVSPAKTDSPNASKGISKGSSQSKQEIDKLIQEIIDGTVLLLGDFDFQVRRILAELRNRDRQEGTARCEEALQSVKQCCATKERAKVRNWKAYIYTLLSKHDPELAEEMRDRDKRAQRQDKGKGKMDVERMQ